MRLLHVFENSDMGQTMGRYDKCWLLDQNAETTFGMSKMAALCVSASELVENRENLWKTPSPDVIGSVSMRLVLSFPRFEHEVRQKMIWST